MKIRLTEYLISRVIARRQLAKIKKFRDLHKGESCYIFGDGPTIKWLDITKFSDHPAICCGLLPFHNDFDKLDVRYCMLVEPWYFAPKFLQAPRLHETRTIAAEYRRFIERTPNKEFFISLSNRFSVSGNNINYIYRDLPEIRNETDRLLSRFSLFAGSFHASLTLAYYLGFSKIYLIGFDGWTIQPARGEHWYEWGQGRYYETTNFAQEFLNVIKQQADIYTIAVEGQSCNAKLILYEEYTGTPARFRENTEILDRRYLEIIATYPGYDIYGHANPETKRKGF